MMPCVGCVRKTERLWLMSCVGVVFYSKQEYLKKHNGMLRAIYCQLLQKLGFEGLLQWYKDGYVEKVKENNSCKLYWDFQFETDRVVESTRPDIAIIRKECKKLL